VWPHRTSRIRASICSTCRWVGCCSAASCGACSATSAAGSRCCSARSRSIRSQPRERLRARHRGYAACRLIAGIGLAGELGAGVTLVSELMGRHNRGIGTMIVAALGISGGLLAGWIGGAFGPGLPWRTAYEIGGGARASSAAATAWRGRVRDVPRHHRQQAGGARQLLQAVLLAASGCSATLAIICVGVPTWYAIGILYTFSNDLGKALGLAEPPNPARTLFFDYAGAAIGGLLSGMLSQYLRSRRRALAILPARAGMPGRRVLPVRWGLEHAVLRAGRPRRRRDGILGGVPVDGGRAVWHQPARDGDDDGPELCPRLGGAARDGFQQLTPSLGLVGAAIAVGVFAFGVAALGLRALPETFGVDLDFQEVDEIEPPRAAAAT